MRRPEVALGIDFTRTGVSAVLEYPDGHVAALRFHGSPQLSTAVAVGRFGRVVAGLAADRQGLTHPHRYLPAGSLSGRQPPVQIGDRTVDGGGVAEAVLRHVWREARHVAGPCCIRRVAIAIPSPSWSWSFDNDVAEAAMRAGMPRPFLTDPTEALAELSVHQYEAAAPHDGVVAVARIDGGGAKELSLHYYRAGRLVDRGLHASRSEPKLVDTAAVEDLAHHVLVVLRSVDRARLLAVVCQVPTVLHAAVVSPLRAALGEDVTVTVMDEHAAAHGALVATRGMSNLWLPDRPRRVGGPLATFGVAWRRAQSRRMFG
jgi:hypothetical protein